MAKLAFVLYEWYETLGPMHILSVLQQAGHSVDVFIAGGEKDLLASVMAFNPQVVAFSCLTGLHPMALEAAEDIKKLKPDTLTLFGGPHFTFVPETLEHPSVDIICRGEGEYAVLDLLNALDNNGDIREIQNLWVKENGVLHQNSLRPLIENLDSLPFPERSFHFKYPLLRKSLTRHFMAGRGCPYDCSFCFNHAWRRLYEGKGPLVRLRSPENLIREILDVKAKYGMKSVVFEDDTFTLKKQWLREFSPLYKREVGLPFFCHVRADRFDEETAHLLKESGCATVGFAVETDNDFIRNEVLHKLITKEQILETARLLKKHKIKFLTFNMLGSPGETLKDAWATINLNAALKTDLPRYTLLQIYPGTEIENYALEKGYLKNQGQHVSQAFSMLQTTHLELSQKDQLINLYKLSYLVTKFPWLQPLARGLIKLPPKPSLRGLVCHHLWLFMEKNSKV